jgi:hypothetical protein
VWPRVACGLAREGARRVAAVDGGAKVAPRRIPHVAKHRVNPGYLNGLLSGHPFASLHCFGVVVVVAVAAVVGHAHVNAPSGHAQKAGGAAVVTLTVGAVVVVAAVVV